MLVTDLLLDADEELLEADEEALRRPVMSVSSNELWGRSGCDRKAMRTPAGDVEAAGTSSGIIWSRLAHSRARSAAFDKEMALLLLISVA
jgi:hypothetical protein